MEQIAKGKVYNMASLEVIRQAFDEGAIDRFNAYVVNGAYYISPYASQVGPHNSNFLTPIAVFKIKRK